MKQLSGLMIALLLATAPVAAPVAAQEAAPEDSDRFEDGLNLLGEGMRLMLEGLSEELAPAIRELEGLVEDLNAYHPPEVLPNGDIIIRRRTPIDPPMPESVVPEGGIEL
jgi:hypothetical protein